MYTHLYRNSHIYLACSTILSLRPHQTEIARPPSSNPADLIRIASPSFYIILTIILFFLRVPMRAYLGMCEPFLVLEQWG